MFRELNVVEMGSTVGGLGISLEIDGVIALLEALVSLIVELLGTLLGALGGLL